MRARALIRPLALGAGALGLWQGLIVATGLPPFLLPGPRAVAVALLAHRADLLRATAITLSEIVAGFALGAAVGIALALAMAASTRIAAALRPALLVSQMIPIFALAPILTLWLGYGMAPKIVVTALICLFPVASAFFDGLERLPAGPRDLAHTMGASRARVLWHLRLPGALPMLGSGLRLAAVYAPVGAVIGEWVGGSQGLGAVMIHANGRMRIDLSFAALALVTVVALLFHAGVGWAIGRGLRRFS